MIRNELGSSLGHDMHEAHRDGEDIPDMGLDFEPELEKLQELIDAMTSLRPVARPTSGQIESALKVIMKEVILLYVARFVLLLV